MNVQYIKVFSCRFSWLNSQWSVNLGPLALYRGGAAVINKVGMIDGVLHKVATDILAVKNCSHSILLDDFQIHTWKNHTFGVPCY